MKNDAKGDVMKNSKGPRWVLAVVLLVGLAGATVAAELDGPASIVFDQYGVPTIIAETVMPYVCMAM